MEKQLEELTAKLQNALGEQIVSVILYGSAAAGDWQERASDLNVLCVLKTVTAAELRVVNPIAKWWSRQGNLPPVLMTEEEMQHSSDCFPLEFHDIQERHRILIGRDLASGLKIDFSFYRVLLEKELRSKQIRLRQKSVELLDQPDRLWKLMSDSISTFCALGRHALLLGKRPPRWKKQEILGAITEATGRDLPAANKVLKLRETGAKPAEDVIALLDQYLSDTNVIVGFVDALNEQSS